MGYLFIVFHRMSMDYVFAHIRCQTVYHCLKINVSRQRGVIIVLYRIIIVLKENISIAGYSVFIELFCCMC